MTPARRHWLRRGLTAIFLAAVGALLVWKGRQLNWHEVAAALDDFGTAALAAAAALAVVAHLIYSSFDLLGRRYAGHGLGAARTMATGFASYAFNLNLGALVGSVGFRFQLYSRAGLKPAQIGRIVAFSLATNWLGYCLLAGVLLLLRLTPIPPRFPIGIGAAQLLGAVMMLTVGAFLHFCRWPPRRTPKVRGVALPLPPWRLAAAQLGLSTLSWMAAAGIIAVLLHAHVPFHIVLGVTMLSGLAGLITHVPAGLGVIEAVFIATLGGSVPESRLVAALLVYRAFYYLVPLALAAGVFALLQSRAALSARQAGRQAASAI